VKFFIFLLFHYTTKRAWGQIDKPMLQNLYRTLKKSCMFTELSPLN